VALAWLKQKNNIKHKDHTASKPLKCKNQISKCKNTNQNSKMNVKNKETMNYSNIFWFLRLGEGIILHFNTSFCFLNFDISFPKKTKLYGSSKKFLLDSENQWLKRNSVINNIIWTG